MGGLCSNAASPSFSTSFSLSPLTDLHPSWWVFPKGFTNKENKSPEQRCQAVPSRQLGYRHLLSLPIPGQALAFYPGNGPWLSHHGLSLFPLEMIKWRFRSGYFLPNSEAVPRVHENDWPGRKESGFSDLALFLGCTGLGSFS